MFVAIPLLLVSPLAAIFSFNESAQAARSRMTISENTKNKVKKRALAAGISVCIKGGAYNLPVNYEKVASGEWGYAGFVIYVGYSVESSGESNCRKLVNAVKSEFGYGSNIELFCALGGRWDSSEKFTCLGMANNSPRDKSLWRIDRGGEAAAKAMATLESKAKTSLSEEDPLLNYAEAYTVFTTKCDVDWRGFDSGSDDTASPDVKARSDINKKVTVALADGTAAEAWYYLPDFGTRRRLHHILTNEGHDQNFPTCSEIGDRMSATASAAATSEKSASEKSARDAVYEALHKKLCANLGDPALISRCGGNLASQVDACKDKLPKSGKVTDSDALVKCLAEKTGQGEDVIKEALRDVTADGTETEGKEETPKCTIEGVGWLLCPTVDFLARTADAAFGFIADTFLQIEPDLSGANTKDAWEFMRNIANGVFIIAFLIIIVSQITGIGVGK